MQRNSRFFLVSEKVCLTDWSLTFYWLQVVLFQSRLLLWIRFVCLIPLLLNLFTRFHATVQTTIKPCVSTVITVQRLLQTRLDADIQKHMNEQDLCFTAI